ncbi:aldo/keto reductase [Curtobacterium sp. MCBA15_001]|uniref:aldo/keto reductase n=1 Tax=Curtobacterium sp. MCBA15_001 TaxID=1898731 RepID=UPI0008DD691E|nr:aldo/keto reductase [Curtobacterium sp. MCBA15_001]OIH92419.1 aldo/keto reductase [Curtobacterium sp. MCBA15_001]
MTGTNTPSRSDATKRPGGVGSLGGRAVARIGYGAMELARLTEDRAQGVALVRRAIELGVDHVDTAEFYGGGAVNQILHDAIRPSDGVLIASKIGADPNPAGGMVLAQQPNQITASVETQLTTLGVEQIGAMNLRRPGVNPEVPAEQRVDLDAQLAALRDLRDAGKIGAIGLSNVTFDELQHALPLGIACVQNSYSLLERRDEPMLELCRDEGVAWVPFFPLGNRHPGQPRVTDQQVVRAIAEASGWSPAQIGLAWLLHHAPNTFVISGTANPAHLEANLAVSDVVLDRASMAALDRAS